jgi:hypothetical protein
MVREPSHACKPDTRLSSFNNAFATRPMSAFSPITSRNRSSGEPNHAGGPIRPSAVRSSRRGRYNARCSFAANPVIIAFQLNGWANLRESMSQNEHVFA